MPSKLIKFSKGGGCGCKVPPSILARLLEGSPSSQLFPDLLVGLDESDDAAVYRINATQALVATTDFFTPIVDDPYQFGRIAAVNAISDIYAMGGRPIMGLSVLGFPVNDTSESDVRKILEGANAICNKISVPIAGGHSIDSKELFYGLVALGILNPKNLKMNSNGRHNDRLILTKPLGVGIISAGLGKNVVSASTYELLLNLTTQLNTVGFELAQVCEVNAMTDVTGFGLLGHLVEMCKASQLSAEIKVADVPIISDARELAMSGVKTGASARNWDSYRKLVHNSSMDYWVQDILCDPQTSGGLLISCDESGVEKVINLLKERGFSSACSIGTLRKGTPSVTVK